MLTADNGNRTRLSSLGSWRSTDELYPHVYIEYFAGISEKTIEGFAKYSISITAIKQKRKYKKEKHTNLVKG